MNLGDTEQNIKTESSIWQEAEQEGKKMEKKKKKTHRNTNLIRTYIRR